MSEEDQREALRRAEQDTSAAMSTAGKPSGVFWNEDHWNAGNATNGASRKS